jgi:hypothetical protein
MSDPNIISVGNLDDYPRHLWGTRDRAQAKREELARAQVKAMRTPAREFAPLPGPVSDWSGFSLDVPRRPRHQSSRSKSIDLMLDRLGVRPRRD